MKKAIALALTLTLLLCMLAACGGDSGGSADAGGLDPNLPTYDSLKVGEDHTGLTAELRVITQRTPLRT